MYVYVDESGGFVPLDRKRSRVSAVAALVVPTLGHQRLISRTRFFPWLAAGNQHEVKGSALDANQLRMAADLLARFDVIGEAVVVDMGDLSVEEVEDFKARQSQIILNGIPQEASAELREDIERLGAPLRGFLAPARRPRLSVTAPLATLACPPRLVFTAGGIAP